MNYNYVLCFAFCLVGCRGTETFGPFSENIKSRLQKRSIGESIWNSKRAMLGMFQGTQRHTNQKSNVGHFQRAIEDHCLIATMCPSNEIPIPSGDILTGLHFGVENLQSVCNSTEEYLGCYDMMAESYPCGELSTLMANIGRVLQDSLCHQPWTPEVLSILQCMNNRKLQVTIFGEIQKLIGIGMAYHEMGIPVQQQKSTLCRWVFTSFNEMVHLTSSVCEGTVYSTVCEIRNRLDPYMEMMLSGISDYIDCPKETFRCAL
ncbi:uncharacterized protein LOC110467074 [Mizuhopecten yessoensis]|uniref:uncharacterized protein LOC110467074 n=1 Tax=Mizuhopecten yessoensis TaxID=6573 RepID=UPI000B45ABFD|nr:uncharacterized protein LOC110467074 [Mizuhopecten yessoensis]